MDKCVNATMMLKWPQMGKKRKRKKKNKRGRKEIAR